MRRKLLTILGIVFIASTVYAAQVVDIQPFTYSIKTTVISVTTTATKLPTTPLAGRKYLSLQNIGSSFVYIGDSTVTADTASTGGKQLAPYAVMTRSYDSSVDLYGIVASGTCNVVIEEGK